MKLLGVIILLCTCLNVVAQTDPVKQNIIELRIELIAEQYEDADVDFTTLFDELSYYFDYPLNLNDATEDELKSLFLLTDKQVLELINYREKHKQILTVYELPHIYSFDKSTVDLILPFVDVKPSRDKEIVPLKDRFKYGRNQLFIRYQRILEEMEGYSDIDDSVLALNPNKRYLGSADRLYMRYRYQFRNNLSIGLTADKDAGEQFFAGHQKYGFDFYSAHLFAKDLGRVKRLAIGDYQIQYGQGLALWSGLAFGKSAIVRNMKRNGQGIRPYTSVDENLFMRGAAATLGFGKFEVTAFGSYKSIDGNLASVDTTDNLEEVNFTSFQQTGYHRTPGEIQDKDAIKELYSGTHIAYKTERANIGLSGVYTKFDRTLNKNTQIYNQFDFQGTQNTNISVDYNFFAGPFNFFGESAISEGGGMAHIAGFMSELDSRVRLLTIHRRYDRDYKGLLANGFGEGSNTSNEIGTVFGIEAKLHKYFDFTGYADFYRWNWLGYQRNGLGNGQDYIGQLNFKPNRKTSIYLRYKWETKPRNFDELETNVEAALNETKQQLRLHLDRRLGNIKLRSRFEWVVFDPNDDDENQHGFLIYQDVIWKARELGWRWLFMGA